MFECQFHSCGVLLDSFLIVNEIYSLKWLVKVLKYFKNFFMGIHVILPLALKLLKAFNFSIHPLPEVYI